MREGSAPWVAHQPA